MKARLVVIPPLKEPIQPAPGFAKKQLASFKLDGLGLCQFACTYCSSNAGRYLRTNRERFADLTEQQLGARLFPGDNPDLTFFSPDTLVRLDEQLAKRSSSWGAGETLVYSMLTDGFSPLLEQSGHTRTMLEWLIGRTSFRIRILTKSAVVGHDSWVEFFARHRNRVVVGLSTGSNDDRSAKRIEIGASVPSARLRALARLQAAGVATFGMLCPVLPDMLERGTLEELVDAVRPNVLEHLWAAVSVKQVVREIV